MLGLCQVHPAPSLGQPHLNSARGQQGDHDPCLIAGECPLELTDHHRVEASTGILGGGQQSGCLARRAHGRLRDVPTSKNSAAICPRPAITRPAASTCHARDDTGS